MSSNGVFVVVRAIFVAAVVIALTVGAATAQQAPSKKKVPETPPVASSKPAVPALKPIPSPVQLLNLVRTTMLALNQANLTGNYTVLRDLGAPDFQRTNNPAVLAETFRDLRIRGLDLSPVATISPKFVREPSIDTKGVLRLTGFFPSRPQQVNFDLAFELVSGRWKPRGISVSTASIGASGVAAAPEHETPIVPPNPSQSTVNKNTSAPSVSKPNP